MSMLNCIVSIALASDIAESGLKLNLARPHAYELDHRLGRCRLRKIWFREMVIPVWIDAKLRLKSDDLPGPYRGSRLLHKQPVKA